MRQIPHGIGPHRPSFFRRHYDYLKTFHPEILAGTLAPPTFPDTFTTDYGGQVPDQLVEDNAFTPPVVPLPEGCTDETTARLISNLNLGNPVVRPDTIDKLTNANASGGYSVSGSLQAAVNAGLLVNKFELIAHAPLDYFDTFHLAQISGLPELRSISWGTPWFQSWQGFIETPGNYILPMPTAEEMAAFNSDPNAETLFTWHNHLDIAWDADGYSDLSWQGPNVGKNGRVVFTRELTNAIMGLRGTVALTGTNMGGVTPVRVTYGIWQEIESLLNDIKSLMGYSYGAIHVSKSWWNVFCAFIEEALGGSKYAPVEIPPAPVTPPNTSEMPSQPTKTPSVTLSTSPNILYTFCSTIKLREGANPVNNNPGNCKFYYGGYLPKYGIVTRNPHGFAVFQTEALGWMYLEDLVTSIIKEHPVLTFYTFFAGNGIDWGGYAPAADSNDPLSYATQVATACGKPVDSTVSVILV